MRMKKRPVVKESVIFKELRKAKNKRRVQQLDVDKQGRLRNLTHEEIAALENLRKVEGKMRKKPPWFANNVLVRANLNMMDKDFRKKLNNYARQKGISLPLATKDALEVVRRIEHFVSKEATGRPRVSTLTFLHIWPQVEEGFAIYQLLDLGQLPKIFDEYVKGQDPKEQLELLKFYVDSVKKEKEKADKGIRVIGDHSSRSDHIHILFPNSVIKILKGQKVGVEDLHALAHEPLHAVGILSQNHSPVMHKGKIHTSDELTERYSIELEKNLHKLFPQYYKKKKVT